jgi:hypothetical protein
MPINTYKIMQIKGTVPAMRANEEAARPATCGSRRILVIVKVEVVSKQMVPSAT